MPYKPNERTYRSFSASNFQPIVNPLSDVDDVDEERSAEPTYKVRGYASTFNEEYELYPRVGDWPAEYEQVDPHAFDGVDTSDTIMQFDHNGPVMARTRNGSLQIGVDQHGLWCEAYLGGCQQGRDLFEAIQNGLIDEMSFGFMIADDTEGRGTTTLRDEQGDYHTTITRVARLYDVSAVSIPANPGTEIHTRSAVSAVIEADRKAEQERHEAEERQKAEQEKAEREKQLAMLALRAKALSIQSI